MARKYSNKTSLWFSVKPYNINHKYVVIVVTLKRYLNFFVTVYDDNIGTNERVIASPNVDVQEQVFGIADLFGFERPNVRHSLFCHLDSQKHAVVYCRLLALRSSC